MEKNAKFPLRSNDVVRDVTLANDDGLLADEETLSLSQFAVSREIGKGQFSQVYSATFRPCPQRQVAIKRVELLEMVDSKARADCLKEVQLLKQLKHPNVVRYLGSFEEKQSGQLLIVLELAGAGDLAKFLFSCQRHSRLMTEQAIWRFFVQIASALSHIHEKRIVHRDIKPANVFLTSDLTVKLGDLGLGRFFSSKTFAAHSLVGTPYYMSPERLNQCGYDFSSDIWSLGCLLYEMAALQPPFNCFKSNWNALRQNIERCEYPPLPSDRYSDDMRHLVGSCLQRAPTERPDALKVFCIAKTLYLQSSVDKIPVVDPSSRRHCS
ncbi:serine/threonine-protein kinase Nek7-like [Daphnia carinata]|uniref:serine/threonine-protein kinase Nek7-like n=1 Tax=Daphnia carinata TaxID=120202 RepID=UPI00257F172F|nr:serine/threonine-protein kinase Nek7-like [Daphnia carinata]